MKLPFFGKGKAKGTEKASSGVKGKNPWKGKNAEELFKRMEETNRALHEFGVELGWQEFPVLIEQFHAVNEARLSKKLKAFHFPEFIVFEKAAERLKAKHGEEVKLTHEMYEQEIRKMKEEAAQHRRGI
jgi:hypothetical protein